MNKISRFSFPTDIRFGAGARSLLNDYAEKYNIKKPILVTDSGLVHTDAYRLMVEVMETVWPKAYVEFHDVHPNPTDRDVENAWQFYDENNCDGVVGIGGGSALDAAKALRAKAVFPDLDLIDIPVERLPERLAPFCAIPTTAGTGSEVGRSSVITMEKLGRKAVLFGPPLLADLALLDPELTVSLPPDLTAATGMDAFSHNIESLVCPAFHPMCDAIALKGIELVADNLEKAVTEPADIEARGNMMIAAMMGAVAFQKDLGATHSMAHPLSTLCNIQHGLANALCLVPVMRFNKEIAARQYAAVAGCFGINTYELSDLEAADAAIEAVADLNRNIGIPGSLEKAGIPHEKLALLAQQAYADPCHRTNPRKCTEEDFIQLYQEAFKG